MEWEAKGRDNNPIERVFFPIGSFFLFSVILAPPLIVYSSGNVNFWTFH